MSVVERRELALQLLNAAAAKAKRTGNVSFPPGFISGMDGRRAPLAQLIQGGRGGEVRLKLYLCITMMATSAPYDLRATPTPNLWARLLALPSDTGPRRVSNNLKWLHDNHYISLRPRPGLPAMITLLSAHGDGGDYVRASEMRRYVGVPVELWTKGWLLDLTPTGLALLFILLELQGGYKEPRYVPRYRRESYGLSSDTWTRARKELEQYGLLTVRRIPQGGDFDYRRLRNTYWIDVDRLKLSPDLRTAQ
ncbi:hypothetical protein ACBI99_42960 [Nonomuraea sp. ATR24]|uniref:hypothetical protein n=1 Tax=Nonomuraea sp. ATR24 TaxID=1676744 RepID=UPI0035C12AAE